MHTRTILFAEDPAVGVNLSTAVLSVAEDGRAQYLYRLLLGDMVLLEGADYWPAILQKPEGGWVNRLEGWALIHLLEFLAKEPGEMSDDYFKGYTPAMKAWMKTEQFQSFRKHVKEMRP